MKDSESERPMPMTGPQYGRSLRGLGFSLIVPDVAAAVNFATTVLGATRYFGNQSFAAMKLNGGDFMFHADETFAHNALSGSLQSGDPRGIGVELRIYGCDPDAAEARARQAGFTVLAGSSDRPHGLRECMILDDTGFVWIPSVQLKV